jgi:hypothetical protein
VKELPFEGMINQLRGDIAAVHESAELLTCLSTEHGFPQWVEFGNILNAWVLAQNGDETPTARLRRAISEYRRAATRAAVGAAAVGAAAGADVGVPVPVPEQTDVGVPPVSEADVGAPPPAMPPPPPGPATAPYPVPGYGSSPAPTGPMARRVMDMAQHLTQRTLDLHMAMAQDLIRLMPQAMATARAPTRTL